MPTGQPFTSLCQQLADNRSDRRVDLHLHTTFSDGLYSPAQIVDLAKRSGLPALAVTDHDTVDGIEPTRLAANGRLEIVSGVEITTEHRGKEQHLLAYFFSLEDSPLLTALARLREARTQRFREMIDRLKGRGVHLTVSEGDFQTTTPGRRHLAELLVKAGEANSIRQAFQRFLHDRHPIHVAKARLDMRHAIQLVREAGGVTSWAHPSGEDLQQCLKELAQAGLNAIEVEFPAASYNRTRLFRQWAGEHGLAVTGGSDCHGPEPLARAVGSHGITLGELETLRARAAQPLPSVPSAH